MKTTIKLTALFALLAITACSKLDVVGNDSARAFNDLLQNARGLFLVSEYGEDDWSIRAPDGSACFVWSKDFTADNLYNVFLEFDAIPFHNAGLDLSRLPDDFVYLDGTAIVGTILGIKKLQYDSEVTPLASYQQIVKLKRNLIGYHGQLDHYGINLGDGNMFEWAKNLTTNDKDIVFVLNPDPFIAAGVDVAKIEGWAFAKVTVDDENGKPVQVDKLLKPFDLL